MLLTTLLNFAMSKENKKAPLPILREWSFFFMEYGSGLNNDSLLTTYQLPKRNNNDNGGIVLWI
jgi:hypothetical protein